MRVVVEIDPGDVGTKVGSGGDGDGDGGILQTRPEEMIMDRCYSPSSLSVNTLRLCLLFSWC